MPLNHLRKTTIVIFFVALSAFAGAQEKNLIHVSQFTGEYKGFDIDLKRELLSLGGQLYRLTSRADFFLGYIEEREDFIWNENGEIIPQSYRYKQKVFGISRKRKIDFDWDGGYAQARDGDDRKKIELSPGVLGPMTYQLQLQMDLLRNAEQFTYRFIKRTRMKHYQFQIVAQEDISYDGHTIEKAVKLERLNESKHKTSEAWFDADQHYTLASLSQIKDDDAHLIFRVDTHFTETPPANPLTQLIKGCSDTKETDGSAKM